MTTVQEQQVQQLFAANKETMRTTQLALLKAQKALQEAVTANPDDEAAINADASTLATALAKNEVMRTKLDAQVAAILTSTQQAKWAEKKQERRARLEKFIARLSQSS